MAIKPKHLMLSAAVVAVAYLAAKRGTTAAVPGGATEIFPEGDTNGWRYFSDGIAISPDGTYYKNGVMIFNNMM